MPIVVRMPTVLAFHAHPDDEAILTGGTLARAAAERHRVVLVVATDGVVHAGPGRSGTPDRLAELRAAADALGVHRVEHLGYADSGYGPPPGADGSGRTRFADADTGEAATLLAALLDEERVDLLLTYDANGGYGHRDHVKVHEVGQRAAALADTPRTLQATMPRELLLRAQRAAHAVRLPGPYDNEPTETLYSPQASITHRIDVRRYAGRKRRALAAHRSQWADAPRPARLAARLFLAPNPLFGLLFGREWFIDPAADPNLPRRTTVFG